MPRCGMILDRYWPPSPCSHAELPIEPPHGNPGFNRDSDRLPLHEEGDQETVQRDREETSTAEPEGSQSRSRNKPC